MAVQGIIRPVASIDMRRSPDLQPLLDAWHKYTPEELVDVKSGPLAAFVDDMVAVEADGQGEFIYIHYGSSVTQSSGLSMLGKTTRDFHTGIGAFFAESYRNALRLNEPIYTSNKAKLTHWTHSWQRLLLPISASKTHPQDRVIALVRPVALVSEVLSDFTRDNGFLGGTLEPVLEDGTVVDYALMALSDPVDVFGLKKMARLSDLYDRPLTSSEIDRIAKTHGGGTAISQEVQRSEERFGRIFMLRITGGSNQPLFSLQDASALILARNAAEDRKIEMEQFATIASDWLWETDENHIFTKMTDAIEEAAGIEASTLLGQSRFSFAPLPENEERFARHRQDIDARQPFKGFVYQGETPHGETRWYRVNGAPHFDRDGTFLGYRGTGSDITAEVVAREDAERRKQTMEDFASTASDWMWETDENDRFIYMSSAVKEHTGVDPQDYMGDHWFDIEHVSGNAEVLSAHRKVWDARKPYRDIVYRVPRADGSPIWVRSNGMPIFDKDDRFHGYRGTGSNITAEIEAREAAEEHKQAMEDFASTASDWMWESDADHNMTYLSQAVEAVTGHRVDHFIGRSRFGFADLPDNADVFAEHRKDITARKSFRGLVYRIHAADGSDRWLRINGIPRFAEDGSFLGYRGTGSNITEEVEARAQAARRTDELAEAHRLGRLGAWSYNRKTRKVTLSPEYLELVGMPQGRPNLSLKRVMGCFAPSSWKQVVQSYRKLLRTRAADTIDIEWVRGRARSMDLNVVAKTRCDSRGQVAEVYGTVQDITERKKAERELEALAFHDPLTGLGNRAYFSRELDTILQLARKGRTKAGLLLLDLDHFKEVNDTLGHAAGDELLRRVSERLSMTMNGRGRVFRLGGDEFAILVPSVNTAEELASFAAAIISAFSGTVKLNDGAVHISTSVGMVTMPSQTADADETMRFADLALYEAKSEGRNRYVLFHSDLDREVQNRVNLARDLRQSIQQDDLDAHFQLQVDVMSGKVAGFEALARWNHPTRGDIPPDTFIPIAEGSRLIADLGAWMVGRVCRQGRAWLDAGGAPLQMAVNLSVAQLWHRDVEHDIKTVLDKTGFPPELLCVELTESVFSDDAMPRIQRLFAGLKKIGVQIALDDFGTGYSSLQYLNTLSFDKLKIDRSFVQGCDANSEQRRLLQGVVGLGKGLGLGIVVEGVETEAELQVVCDLGCDAVQGFFFAKPRAFHEACLDAAQVEADYGFQPVVWRDSRAPDTDAPLIRRVKDRLAEMRTPLPKDGRFGS